MHVWRKFDIIGEVVHSYIVMSIVSLIKRHYRSAAVLLGVFAVLFSSLLFVNQALANSDNPVVKAGEKLVNIYDRGTGRTVITKARTIRETLKAANIKVDEKTGRNRAEPRYGHGC